MTQRRKCTLAELIRDATNGASVEWISEVEEVRLRRLAKLLETFSLDGDPDLDLKTLRDRLTFFERESPRRRMKRT